MAQSKFIGAVFMHRAINQNGDQLHIYKKKWTWWFILYSHNSSFFL